MPTAEAAWSVSGRAKARAKGRRYVSDGKTHAQGRVARVGHLMRGPWLRGGSG